MSTLSELQSAWVQESAAKAERFYQASFTRRDRRMLAFVMNHHWSVTGPLIDISKKSRVARRLSLLDSKALARRLDQLIEDEARA